VFSVPNDPPENPPYAVAFRNYYRDRVIIIETDRARNYYRRAGRLPLPRRSWQRPHSIISYFRDRSRIEIVAANIMLAVRSYKGRVLVHVDCTRVPSARLSSHNPRIGCDDDAHLWRPQNSRRHPSVTPSVILMRPLSFLQGVLYIHCIVHTKCYVSEVCRTLRSTATLARR
jgi:hypothetical protein